MNTPPRTTAIILFAHGSRDRQWRTPIERIAQLVAIEAPSTPVMCAYLELSEPDLPTACAALLNAHPLVRTLRILPVFLGIGKHAREDLPTLIVLLHQQYPQLTIEQLPAVGENPEVLALIAKQALGL